MLLESANIGVHSSHILRIDKDKGLFRVKPQSQNVLNIFISQFSELSQITAILMEIFFVISDLNNEGNVKGLLKILVEDKREHVA